MAVAAVAESKPETKTPIADIVEVKEKESNYNSDATPKRRVAGLSLSSLRAKKEHQNIKRAQEPIPENLPKNAFTEADMQKHWADFIEITDKEGKKILSSNLNTDVPKMKNSTTIWIELPNDTMKKEIERDQYDLMEYLRKNLSNYDISLYISINETAEKKYAFTPEEKYLKLREKNPIIDLLRQEFDLDISS